MEPRMQRALHIAATNALAADDRGRWRVPSQNGTGTYLVVVTADGSWACSCPDGEVTARCKHALAVEVTCQREARRPAIKYTPVDTVKYTQNWHTYNQAQTNEKDMFLALLHELCSTVPQPVQEGRGQRILPLADMVFAMVHRTYTGLSARRFQSDLRDAHDAGLIGSTPDWSSVLRYLGRADLTPILVGLIELSAHPLTAVERDFAVDSSGFGTTNKVSWFSTKHGRVIESRVWRKAHIMCGVRTHIVTAVTVTDKNGADSPEFPGLVDTTIANGFDIEQVSADKAYLSYANMQHVEDAGAVPFVPFKSNSISPVIEDSAWARMYHRFAYDRERFDADYHKRSNVETTFSMVKRKFGDSLRGRTTTAQDNEVLTKLIAHNLCRLVHAHYELGITPDLATGTLPEPATPVEPERHLRVVR